MGTKKICVFCGSQVGNQLFLEKSRLLGEELGLRGLTLIYGGGNQGLMGAVASGCDETGGNVIAVIPTFLSQIEHAENRPFEKRVVQTLFERKKEMFELADGFIALPGGIGTLDEITEVLALLQLQQIAKPIGFLNVNEFYNPLFAMLRHFHENALTHHSLEKHMVINPEPKELLDSLVREI
tara:strand:+ start:2856 stop:3401 length:546 start_codon:yes stop_codon:yes gene_type:complete